MIKYNSEISTFINLGDSDSELSALEHFWSNLTPTVRYNLDWTFYANHPNLDLVLSRGSTLAADARKEPVDKPRDFMDEDDVEMVRGLSILVKLRLT